MYGIVINICNLVLFEKDKCILKVEAKWFFWFYSKWIVSVFIIFFLLLGKVLVFIIYCFVVDIFFILNCILWWLLFGFVRKE